MSPSHRVFAHRIVPSVNSKGQVEWFCIVREGMLGPFASEEVAAVALREFVELCRGIGATGGRDQEATEYRPIENRVATGSTAP